MRSRFPILLAAAGVAGLPVAPALEGRPPHLRMEGLERTAPGWVVVENAGDAAAGSVAIERVVWPHFYLHWMPLRGSDGVGSQLSAAEAVRAVRGLWEGLVIDGPLEGKKTPMPAHEAIVFETNIQHGEWRSRYFVWLCKESGRLFIADTNMSLQAHAPAALLELQGQMARTVRCHADAKVDEHPSLTKRREIPESDISYMMPFTWSPVAGYRIQKTFGKGEFGSHMPAITRDRGQDLAVELDALRRLFVVWEPAGDFPMSFDALTQRVHAFWKDRAQNVMPSGTRVSNDVWMMDGIVRISLALQPLPPSRLHKFRAWMWRKDGVSYLAVGELGGVRIGQRVMTEVQEIGDQMLEEMFQAVDY